MASHRERNDRRGGPTGHSQARPHHPRSRAAAAPEGAEWLWGWHTVEAAVLNPERQLQRLLVARDKARAIEAVLRRRPGEVPALRIEEEEPRGLGRLLPPGAVHGGVALLTSELADPGLDALLHPAEGLILVLDQVTDPQNVGALLRSAAAFGARGVVLQDRHSPALAGALAKAAAGAVERVPVVRVVNLSRTLERIADAGWRSVGLAGGADTPLGEALDGGPTALVLGSEGEGLRRLVAEHCDALASIPMPGGFESLNVSAAGAVALYEAMRSRQAPARGERG